MLSRDQEYDVTSGSEVVLDCEFHMDGYRMFDNPTVWEKNQLDERTRVNIMGVLQEPFASTRRFEVVFVEQRPRYCLRLTIRGSLRNFAFFSLVPLVVNRRAKFEVFFSSNRFRDIQGSQNSKSRLRDPFTTCKWGSPMTLYFDSSTPICLFTIQLSWGYDDD